MIYLKWFDEFLKETPMSGYIYIKTKPEICLSRIHKRNREGEEGIPLEYLLKCESYHNNWLNKEISVATMKGGIATLKSFSLLKYITKKTKRGPKSATSLIMGLCIRKC